MNTGSCVYTTSRRQRARGRFAFTLVEMVVSLSIISIIFLAMGSVMLLSAKAMPTADDPSSMTLEASDILQQIVSDLQTATSIIDAQDTWIIFTVPDRDNDGNDERIVYYWNGTAGNLMTRIYKNNTQVAILPNVYEFNLVYDTKSIPQPDLLVESAEVELSSHVGLAGASDYIIDNTAWVGQYFVPSGLPADAVGWSVTRVLFEANTNGATKGIVDVQLRPALAGGLPDITVLEASTMLEKNLSPGYLWQEFTFSSVINRTPGKGLCLVLQWIDDDIAADISTDSNAGSGMLVTSTGGAAWSNDPAQSMNYYVYGTYTTPVPQPPINVLRSVTLTLNPGKTPASRVRTAVTTLNQPVMP